MRPPKINLAESKTDDKTPPSKWNSILTATPVVLTVVATIMAGLSTSEMSLAQYRRSLAAQYQSKAGDQWGFFQAKRIRGTSLEMTIDLLDATAQPQRFDGALLESSADRLAKELRRAQQEAQHFSAELNPALAALGPTGAKLKDAAAKLAQTAQESIANTEAVRHRIQKELQLPEVQQAMAFLSSTQLAPLNIVGVENNPEIGRARDAIRERRPDRETLPILLQIREEAMQHAIELAETNIQLVERADQPMSTVLGQINAIVQEQVGAARQFAGAMRRFDAAIADLSGTQDPSLANLRDAAASLDRSAANVKAVSSELALDFKAAQHAYTARRYEREARWNQDAAGLYEVEVHMQSANSERHRARSKSFFFGMLAAQAGVTIATISLAVKHRNVLWSLASVAGVGAILFGLYVYLYV